MNPDKQLLLDEIQEKVDTSQSFIVAQYNKLDAELAQNFRKTLVKSGSSFSIVRKRIFEKAAKTKGYEISKQHLQGHIGIIFSGDEPLEAIKTVCEFGKDHAGVVSVLSALFEGKLYFADDVEKLSKLPGKDQMRSELLGLFEAPMAQTLSVFEALLTSVPHCLQNKIEKENS